MVLKLWDVDNGKAVYLKYTNSKNESRLVKLKDPIDSDRVPLSDLDKAIELMIRYVSSIKKLDNFGAVNSGKDGKIETKQEMKVEENNVENKQEENVEVKSGNKVEASSLEEGYDKNNANEVPHEVNDKLNLLLNKNEERKDGAQFLINLNAKKGEDTVKEMK